MLILTRKPGEQIIIGDNEITISVLRIRGNQVLLGTTATENISIHRKEIYDKIQIQHNQEVKDEDENFNQ